MDNDSDALDNARGEHRPQRRRRGHRRRASTSWASSRLAAADVVVANLTAALLVRPLGCAAATRQPPRIPHTERLRARSTGASTVRPSFKGASRSSRELVEGEWAGAVDAGVKQFAQCSMFNGRCIEHLPISEILEFIVDKSPHTCWSTAIATIVHGVRAQRAPAERDRRETRCGRPISISAGLHPPSGPTKQAGPNRADSPADRRDRVASPTARRWFHEHQPALGVVLQQPLGPELDAVADDRQHGAPALFGGRNRNASPAIRRASVAEPVQANRPCAR